ncbi:hypothetical protein BDV98DRAFT_603218 [Pterulicium gracile]|uniref:Uncharacterized protein n=1 Tax=Pterulicium gracile TaxID=1884261 RepID=A0A5C3QRE6_9AGAR|nr:hypothetical protein BDV98DRAFT_603218 [Pterula gracilis]
MSVTASDSGDVHLIIQAHKVASFEDDEDESDDRLLNELLHSKHTTDTDSLSSCSSEHPTPQWSISHEESAPSTSATEHSHMDIGHFELNETLPGIKAALDSVSHYEACTLMTSILHPTLDEAEQLALYNPIADGETNGDDVHVVDRCRGSWKEFTESLISAASCLDVDDCSPALNPTSTDASPTTLLVLESPASRHCERESADPRLQHQHPHSETTRAACPSSPTYDDDHDCDIASRSFSSASSGLSLHRSVSSSRSSATSGDGDEEVDVVFDSPPLGLEHDENHPPVFDTQFLTDEDLTTHSPTTPHEVATPTTSNSVSPTTTTDDEPVESVTRRKHSYPKPSPPTTSEVLKTMADFHQRFAQRNKPRYLASKSSSASSFTEGDVFGGGVEQSPPQNRGGFTKKNRVGSGSVTIKTASGVLLGEVGGTATCTDRTFWEGAARSSSNTSHFPEAPHPGMLYPSQEEMARMAVERYNAAFPPVPSPAPIPVYQSKRTSSKQHESQRPQHPHHLRGPSKDQISLPTTPSPSRDDSPSPASSDTSSYSNVGRGASAMKARHTRQNSMTTLRSALLVRKSRSAEGSPRAGTVGLKDEEETLSSGSGLSSSAPAPNGDHSGPSPPSGKREKGEKARAEELEADSDGWFRVKSSASSSGDKEKERKTRKKKSESVASETRGREKISTKPKDAIVWPSLNDPPATTPGTPTRDQSMGPRRHTKSTSSAATASSHSSMSFRSGSIPPASSPVPSLLSTSTASSQHHSPPFKVIPRLHPPPSNVPLQHPHPHPRPHQHPHSVPVMPVPVPVPPVVGVMYPPPPGMGLHPYHLAGQYGHGHAMAPRWAPAQPVYGPGPFGVPGQGWWV